MELFYRLHRLVELLIFLPHTDMTRAFYYIHYDSIIFSTTCLFYLINGISIARINNKPVTFDLPKKSEVCCSHIFDY